MYTGPNEQHKIVMARSTNRCLSATYTSANPLLQDFDSGEPLQTQAAGL